MASTLTSDFAPWEVGAAIVIALAIQLGNGVALWAAKTPDADIAEVDKAVEQPVKVKPVMDEEALQAAKLGGKKVKLPDMWERAPASVKRAIQEKPAPPPDVAAPSTKADENPAAIPDKDKKVGTVEDAGTEVDASTEGADAGLTESNEDAGPATLDTDGGTGNGTDKPGCVGVGCEADGGLDDFQAGQYQGRLISFFKRGFSVTGLGLPPEEIKKLAVSVSVQLSGDGTVSSFSMGSSGNATFDAAARAAMQGKVGQPVPNPPEDRPDLKRSSLSFTMTCGSGCN